MGNIHDELKARLLLGVEAEAKDMAMYSSMLGALPNPDSVLKKLGLDISAYYDLDIDDQVASTMQLRKDNVKSMKWELTPNRSRDDIYNFIQNVIKKWDMERIIGDMLEAIPYGYAVLEKIWLKDSYGYYYVSSVIGKPPHWFKFDANGGIRFLSNKSRHGNGVLLSKKKFTVVQNYPTYLNPYGSAIYKRCFWPVKFKRGGVKFFARFVEKYGMIHLLGQIGKNGDGTQKVPTEKDTQKMIDTLDGLIQDGVGSIPGTDEVMVIAGNSTASNEIYKGFLEVCDRQIAKAILSHSSAVDSTAGELGNKDQIIQSINIIRDSDANLVIGNFNEIISQMVEENFGIVDEEEIPLFTLNLKGEANDTADWAKRDLDLKALGVSFSKEYIKERYGLSDEEFDMTVPALAPTYNQFSENQNESILSEKFQKVLQPIIDLINEGKDFDEIKKSILEANKDLDTSELEEFIFDIIATTLTEESQTDG